MELGDAGADSIKSIVFDRYESIGVEDIAEGEEVLLVMGPEKSGKTNFIRALYLASDARSSNNSFNQPASKQGQRTINTASNARYKITEAHRLHSKHLPEIDSGTGERKRIESVVVLECSSEYYSSEDPQSYDPLLDLLRQKRCRVGVLICGNIISGSPAPSQELVDLLGDRTDLQNLTLVETNWDRATIWRGWKESAYHTRMVEGPWKDLVAFKHASVAQYDNKKSPALDAWRIVLNTLRTDLKGSDIVILIMGPTGAGKSSFIRAATGLPDVKVGYGLKSETQWVNAWTAKKTEGGRRVVYIDTPGFDDTAVADSEMLERIATWLHQNLTNSIPISGILYFHRISDNRMSGSAVQNLEIFQKLCGYNDSDFTQRIRFVTTMWDEVEPSDGERRLDELRKMWWAKMLKKGAKDCALRRKGEPSIEAVKDITSAVIINSTSPVSLSTPHDTIQSVPVQGDDIVILVMGPDEDGKNAFLRAAKGPQDVELGDGLKPKSEPVIAWTAKRTEAGRRVVYIDTSGFASIQSVIEWLRDNLGETIPISAILYFQISDSTTGTETASRYLEDLRQRCGFDIWEFHRRIFFLTTQWDEGGPSEGARRLKNLRVGRPQPSTAHDWTTQPALAQSYELSIMAVEDVPTAIINYTSPVSPLSLCPLLGAVQSGDIVILALGHTGTGKNAFVHEATGQPDLDVGDDSKSKDQIVTACIAKNAQGGPRVVYIDTPGFDTADRAPLEKVANWLQKNLANTVPISAVLYFPQTCDGRSDTTETSVHNLQLFQQLCGFDEFEFCRRAFLATMMQDEGSSSQGGGVGSSPYQLQLVPLIKKEGKEDALWQKGQPSVMAIKNVVPTVINLKPGTSSLSLPRSRVVVQSSDIVVLVMGHTGTGKSTFIRAATGQADGEGEFGLQSKTRIITAWTAKNTEGGRRVVYVDTPGFDNTSARDPASVQKVVDWLHQNLTNTIPIFAILYFHRIGDAAASMETGVENLQLFQQLCGFDEFDFCQRLSFITTNWDVFSLPQGYARLKELRKCWTPIIKKGAKLRVLREPNEPSKPSIRVVQGVAMAVINSTPPAPSLSLRNSPVTFQSGDIVILIIGPSGSGKSAFIRAATGQPNVEVGDGLKLKTATVTAWTAKNTEAGRRLVYIDTPGFEQTYTGDDEVVQKIVDGLRQSFTDTISISAILYLQRIDDVAEAKADRASVQRLGLLRQRCGLDESRVFLITTMWDMVDPAAGDQYLSDLRKVWSPLLLGRAHELALRQHYGLNGSRSLGAEGPSIDSVKHVVQSVVHSASNTSSKPLNSSRTAIQGELQQGKGALNTAAARVLYKQTGIQKKRLQEIVTKLQVEEAAITDDDTLKAMLKKELDDAQQELHLVETQEDQLVKGGARLKLREWISLGLKR